MRKASKSPATESFTVKLTADQARRLRFVAQEEDWKSPECLIARAAVELVHCSLEGGMSLQHRRNAETDLAETINVPRQLSASTGPGRIVA